MLPIVQIIEVTQYFVWQIMMMLLIFQVNFMRLQNHF
jgi:hypothetical protein